MSKSTHQIAVKAVDQTKPAFASIQATAAAASVRIRSMMGGAIAAAGAYLAFSQIKAGIDELGHLSDIAMKTSTSVDELTQTVTAMNVLGIQNMSVEQLAKSFDYMAKTTGRAGMEGFYKTIGEIGKIPDAAQRGQEAMRIFGRSGMEFMPLINAADKSTQALKDVVSAMPRVPQAAADAGDAVADAMTMAADGVKSVWLQALGLVAGWLDSTFNMGFRGAGAAAAAWMEYFAKVGWRHVQWLFNAWSESEDGALKNWNTMLSYMLKSVKEFAVAFARTIYETINVSSWVDKFVAGWQYAFNRIMKGEAYALRIFSEYKKVIDERERLPDRLSSVWADYWKKMEDVSASFSGPEVDDLYGKLQNKLELAKKLNANINDAAISLKNREMKGLGDVDLGSKSPSIRNELMMAGSAKSLSAALVGPQLQSETKKQTKLLETIANNTKSTADNTEKTADASDDVEVID